MSEDIYKAFQNQVYQLSAFEDEDWEGFVAPWKKYDLAKGDYLTRSGSVEHYFYFVHTGVLRAFSIKDGNDISVGFSYNGDYAGVYDSFISREPSDFFIQAITEVVTLRVHYDQMMELFDKYKAAERWGRLFNGQVLIGMARRQVESRSYSAEEKFDRLMEQSPHILQLVPQKYLASYLGMTAETFSRLRRKRS